MSNLQQHHPKNCFVFEFGSAFFFSINKIDNAESLFYDWEFLGYVCILFKVENERSTPALVAEIVNINDTSLVTCGKFSVRPVDLRYNLMSIKYLAHFYV